MLAISRETGETPTLLSGLFNFPITVTSYYLGKHKQRKILLPQERLGPFSLLRKPLFCFLPLTLSQTFSPGEYLLRFKVPPCCTSKLKYVNIHIKCLIFSTIYYRYHWISINTLAFVRFQCNFGGMISFCAKKNNEFPPKLNQKSSAHTLDTKTHVTGNLNAIAHHL